MLSEKSVAMGTSARLVEEVDLAFNHKGAPWEFSIWEIWNATADLVLTVSIFELTLAIVRCVERFHALLQVPYKYTKSSASPYSGVRQTIYVIPHMIVPTVYVEHWKFPQGKVNI